MNQTVTDKDIFLFLTNEELAIEFAQNLELLPQTRECCGKILTKSYRQTAKAKGYYFRCNVRGCRREVSIRKDTFFERSKLRIGQILMIMFYFAKSEVKLTNLMRKTEIKDKGNLIDWLNFCREICIKYFELNPVFLGGPGRIVEVDEAHFVKRKNNMGRMVSAQRVFGAYEALTKKGFLFTVPDCTRETIFPFITTFILPGTMIWADEAKIYDTLPHYGFGLQRVNHKRGQFVNPLTNATTNHVEAFWGRAKLANKMRIGTHRTTLDSHLAEFNWHEHFGYSLEIFIEHVKLVYNIN